MYIFCFIFSLILFQGDKGWMGNPHVDTAVVNIRLQDINDNTPVLTKKKDSLTLVEDTPTGTVLGVFPAHDADAVCIFYE